MSTNGYPFLSKAQTLARIAAEPDFALECVRTIEARHGWMASHRVSAAKLVAKLDAGALDAAVVTEAVRLVSRYTKTLARTLRERDLAELPEVAAVGAVFGVAAFFPAPEAPPSGRLAPAVAPSVAPTRTEAEEPPLPAGGPPPVAK